jgi:hypothetical protein
MQAYFTRFSLEYSVQSNVELGKFFNKRSNPKSNPNPKSSHVAQLFPLAKSVGTSNLKLLQHKLNSREIKLLNDLIVLMGSKNDLDTHKRLGEIAAQYLETL